jgi:hypothetical protein
MNNRELDQLFQQIARKIVSAEITAGPGPLPHGVFEQAPRVIATLDDGSSVELFSFYAHERSFSPAEFVGLSVEEGRRLKFAPGHPPRVDGRARTDGQNPSIPPSIDVFRA